MNGERVTSSSLPKTPDTDEKKLFRLKYDMAAAASKKVILVTGANSGIGYEIVKALLESETSSYHVLVGSRSLDKAKSAMDSLHKECPKSQSTMEALPVDLTSDESIDKAFEQVKASPGHVDTLINNAGLHTCANWTNIS